MKAKKKWIALLLVATILTGCSPLVADVLQTKSIYATFYPVYALAAAIADGAEQVELHCLVQPQDGCLRSYDLSDWDIYMMAYSADAVIAAGNGLEGFSEQLESLAETTLPLAEVMYGLDLLQMDESDDEENHFSGANPHLYMSMYGAEAILQNIAGAMMLFDEINSGLYERNSEIIQQKLQIMEANAQKQTEVCEGVAAAILNEALYYTATDCGLEIVGCYERESSEMLYGESLEKCLNDLTGMGAELVLIEKQAPIELISALEAAGLSVARLETMSDFTEKDGAEGYFEALTSNVQAVVAACLAIEK